MSFLGKPLSALRRAANGRAAKYFFMPLFLALFLRGCVYEPYVLLDVEHVELPARNWEPGMPDIRIGIVSDIHAGDRPLEKWRVGRMVKKLNAEKPDIVFLLGDFVNGFFNISAMPPDELAEILSEIDAPLGVFAVTGNHDAGFGAPKLIRSLEKTGIKFLNNESAMVSAGGKDFYIAGAKFNFDNHYNFKKIFEGVPDGAPAILLMHSPSIFPALPAQASIIFAGHTHGGQVRLPYIGPLTKSHTIQPADIEYGLAFSPRGVPIYISPGIGNSLVNLRLFCPPRIEIATLKSGSAGKP